MVTSNDGWMARLEYETAVVKGHFNISSMTHTLY